MLWREGVGGMEELQRNVEEWSTGEELLRETEQGGSSF